MAEFLALFLFVFAVTFVWFGALWQFFVAPKCFGTTWRKPFWLQKPVENQTAAPANNISNMPDSGAGEKERGDANSENQV